MIDEKKLAEEMMAHTTHETLNGEKTGLAWIQLSNKEWLRIMSSCRVPNRKGDEMTEQILVEIEVRDDLISRKLALKTLGQMCGIEEGVGILKMVGAGKGEMVDRDKVEYMLEELDSAPIQSPALPPSAQARIEAAIRLFKMGTGHPVKGGYNSITYKETVHLLRYFLGQDQPTWEDKDFGLEEGKLPPNNPFDSHRNITGGFALNGDRPKGTDEDLGLGKEKEEK